MKFYFIQIKKAEPPLSLHGQLLWREFFYCAATNNPNFDKMEGNPICVQIPWDKNPQALAKWASVSKISVSVLTILRVIWILIISAINNFFSVYRLSSGLVFYV